MTHLEDLIRETLVEHEAEAPDAGSLLDTVRDRIAAPKRRTRPVAALVAALIVVVIVTGVAFVASAHHRSEAPSVTVPRPTLPRPPAPTVPAPTPTTAPRPAGVVCSRVPYQQVHYSYHGLAAPNGPNLDYTATKQTEGSIDVGRGDVLRLVGLDVELVRRDGTVKLPNAILRTWGDFDGDGRTDVVVTVQDSAGYQKSYMVPGTVAVGTHDPAAVGIGIPTSADGGVELASGPWIAVGDQSHDGADDLLLNQRLYSGRAMTAGPVGGVLPALPAPFRTLPFPIVGVEQFDPSGPPTFVMVDEPHAALVIDGDNRDRLTIPATTGSSPDNVVYAVGSGARVTAWLVGSHRIVQYSYSTRSGETAWRWDLDAPCKP